jgi:putative endonuclease
MPDPRHALGLRAETAAATWLVGRGWRVLARRWRVNEGELDLVCLDPLGTLVGVEVRARRGRRQGSALESIDHRRLGRRRRALVRYAVAHAVRARGLRIDLISVEPEGERWRLVRRPLDAG